MRRIAIYMACLALVAAGLYTVLHLARWNDAYVALEASETAYPVRGAQAERLRVAQAMAESAPPPGMPLGERIHPVGTLAHLRYETLDRTGTAVSSVEVRALVPSLPAFGVDAPGGPYGQIDCPRRCRSGLAPDGAHLVARGGSPGLAPEWVLRMPVGRAFEIPSDSFTLQDVEDGRPLSLPMARYRVTLLETCPARVRMGTARSIDFFPNATVPIPRGIKTSHWVQVEGCGAMLSRKPPRPEPAPMRAAAEPSRPAAPAPQLGIVVPRREGAMGRASLVVDENAKLRHPEDVHVRFLAACVYDAAAGAWRPLPVPQDPLEVSGPGLMNRIRVALRFPEQDGLYWARWTETHAAPVGEVRAYAIAVPSGRRGGQPAGIAAPAGGCERDVAISRP